MRILCIMQARMGSTRLPGKVLKKICDKTVLEHDIDRLKRVKNINEIIIATTTLEKDDVIVEEAKMLGVKYYRGSEDNVLSRYYYAAKENKGNIVVRITSDCPLIDSEITDEIIKFYLSNIGKYDYVSNTIERTYPRGLDTEVFSFGALEKAFNQAVIERDKEHVTPYIWSNPQIFRLEQYKSKTNYSDLRWTLDTKEDFELISKIYEYLYTDNKCFSMYDIIKLLEKYPELKKINEHIQQKA